MIRPILFCRELVPLVMNGRKTRTRRLANPARLDRARWRAGDLLWVRETWAEGAGGSILYAADHVRTPSRTPASAREPVTWRPSIHLPRRHARTWLRVLDVWIEPLKAINGAEVRREGFRSRADLFAMWERINGPIASDNPLVWVIAFEITSEPRSWQQQPLPGFL